jgi:ribosomal protein S6E (S10)
MAGELAVGETGLRRACPVLTEDKEAASVQRYLSSSGDGARCDRDGEDRKHLARGARLPTL